MASLGTVAEPGSPALWALAMRAMGVPPLEELSITFYPPPETDFPCDSNVHFVPPFLTWPGILFFSFGLSGVLAKSRIHPAVLLFDIKACKGKECWGWGFLAKAILPEYPLR